jgi:iron complex outermembrane recepter protein
MKKKILLTPIALVASMLVSGVYAQDKVLSPVTVTGSQDGYIVNSTSSATRTDTPIHEIPQSVVVLNKSLIEDQGARDMNAALRNVSNVSYVDTRDANNTSFKIRGFSSGFVVDGVAMPGFYQGLESMVNIDQIAVIKGPSGGLFGSQANGSAATLGGTVVISTLEPTKEAQKSFEVLVGSYDQKGVSFDVNQPINEVMAVRMSGEKSDSNSEVNRVFFKKTALFPSISLTPSADTKIVLRLRYVDNATLDYSGLPRASTSSGVPVSGLSRSLFVGADGQPDTTNNSRGANLQLTQKINDTWKFNLVLAKNEATIDQNGVFPALFGAMIDTTGGYYPGMGGANQYLTGLRLWQKFTSNTVSPNFTGKFDLNGVKHVVNTGVDYEKSQDDAYMANATGNNLYPSVMAYNFNMANALGASLYDLSSASRPSWGSVTAPPEGDQFWQNNKAKTTSYYIQDQITLDKLHLLAGVRHSNFNVDNVYGANLNDSHSKTSKVSYKFGGAYDLTQSIAPFVGYTESARVPTNSYGLVNPKVEEAKQKEVGVKFKNQNGITATIAYFDLKRINSVVFDNSNPNNPLPHQAGGQQSKGLDLDLNWRVTASWQWLAAYTNQTAKVTEDSYNPTSVGKQLFNVPEQSLRLATRYDIKSGDYTGLGFGLGATHSSKLPGDAANTYFTQAVTIWDAQLSYKKDSARYGVYVSNLFDKQYFRPSAYFGGGQVMPGLPRTIMATAQFSM